MGKYIKETYTYTDPPERLKNVPRLRIRREEQQVLYRMFAALSELVYACDNEDFARRAKAVPGGWRDLRMIRVRLERLMDDLMWTIPLEKLVGLKRDMKRARYDVWFEPVAVKPSHPHQILADRRDVAAVIHAAHEQCRLCVRDQACGSCPLGQALDRLCLQDRGGKSWSWVEIEE